MCAARGGAPFTRCDAHCVSCQETRISRGRFLKTGNTAFPAVYWLFNAFPMHFLDRKYARKRDQEMGGRATPGNGRHGRTRKRDQEMGGTATPGNRRHGRIRKRDQEMGGSSTRKYSGDCEAECA